MRNGAANPFCSRLSTLKTHLAHGILASSVLIHSPAGAQIIFSNDFEAPCDAADVDNDRLSGCQETLYKTNPNKRDSDDDGLTDGDEILGTLGGLDLLGLVVDPRRNDILVGQTSEKYKFTVLPSSPEAGRPFNIRVNVAASSCHVLQPLFPASPQGSNTFRFEVVITDGCIPNLPAQERLYEIAPLPAGLYVFRYAFCGSGVFGYNCTTIREANVSVAPGAVARQVHTVPAWSWGGKASMIALMVFGAFASLQELSSRQRQK